MLRRAEHVVTLTPSAGSTETARHTYATVATLTMEQRKGTYSDYTKAAISVRVDDGLPVLPGWFVTITTPSALAGEYTVKLVAPSPGHTRIVAERVL